MKCNVLFLALFIVAFLFPTVGSVSNAEAQPGKRLCGIFLGTTATLVKVKHPNKKKKRKKIKQLCDRLTDEMVQELTDEQKTHVIRYRRVSCEDVAEDLAGASVVPGDVICWNMRTTNLNDEVKVYRVKHIGAVGSNEFTITRR